MIAANNLLTRIQVFFVLRRADAVARRAKSIKAERDYLNRPHVPSTHMVGYWTPQEARKYAAEAKERNKPACQCDACKQAEMLPAVLRIVANWGKK